MPFKKGHSPWNKGKEFTAMLGNSYGFKNGKAPWNKGKKHLKISGSKHPFWKGGKILQNGYWRILKKEHPRTNSKGYIKYCHIVMEKMLGRLLVSGETVHHKNGNKLDDRKSNLQLLANNSEHMKTCHPKSGFQIGHSQLNTGRTHFKKGHHYSPENEFKKSNSKYPQS